MAHFWGLELNETPVCALGLQCFVLFIEYTQWDWGYFLIVADVVGLMPQRFLFSRNAWQHLVTRLLYANPTGVFCILG